MGLGTERGRSNWPLAADTQGRIHCGDIYLPNDRLGGTADAAKILLHDIAQQQSVSDLPPEVLASPPAGVDSVWRHAYEIERRTSGEALSCFQVEVNAAPICYATGIGSVADRTWQVFRDDEKNADDGTTRLHEAQTYGDHFGALAGIGDLLDFDAD